jgi:cysteinyl-tRNA synthetase
MTGAVRDFVPLRTGHASIYLCGATVRGLPHIGHVRSGVAFDVLRRWLMATGYDVAFIRNVTDIDDKILNKAADAGRPWWEWAATYERAFSAAYDALGVLPPSAEPRATGHITQMVELIERLIERGHAYAGNGDVYFDVLSLPDYGKLSGHKIDDVHQGEGVAKGKRDERDFTLWKGAKPGEPSWPTLGRPPRRHPNASRCARRTWDLPDIRRRHGSGVPGHHGQIAQAEPQATVRFWLQRLGQQARETASLGSAAILAGPQRVQRELPLVGQRALPVDARFSRTRCRMPPRPYTGIEVTLHRVRNRVCAVVPGEWTPKFAAALDDDLSVPIALAEVHAARRGNGRWTR